ERSEDQQRREPRHEQPQEGAAVDRCDVGAPLDEHEGPEPAAQQKRLRPRAPRRGDEAEDRERLPYRRAPEELAQGDVVLSKLRPVQMKVAMTAARKRQGGRDLGRRLGGDIPRGPENRQVAETPVLPQGKGDEGRKQRES